MRGRDVAQAVAQSGQAPERTGVRGDERGPKVVIAHHRCCQVQHDVVRAHHDDGVLDLVPAAKQPDPHAGPGGVSLDPGRHEQQPVGPDERRKGAGALGASGVATRQPPTFPSLTRTQSSIAAGDERLRASVASATGRERSTVPCRRASKGATKTSK